MINVVRGVARTAVIAGTATAASYAVGSRIEKHQDAKYQQQQAEVEAQQYQQPIPEAQQYQPAQYETAGSEPPTIQADSDVASQLQQLVELKQSGMLTDEEFSAAKGRLLGA